jgi:hypothetical protein
MPRVDKISIWLAALSFVVITGFAAHRTPLTQLISMPIMLLFFVLVCASFGRIFTRWRARRWLALVPFAACVAAILAMMIVGRLLHHALFAWALPSYERIVHDIESGQIAVSQPGRSIPEAVGRARLTYAVIASRAPNGSLSVEFLTESGFPVKHSGYLYSASDRIDDDPFIQSRWPICSRMREHWFYISD